MLTIRFHELTQRAQFGALKKYNKKFRREKNQKNRQITMQISRKHVSTSLNVRSEVRITRVCNMYSLLHFSEAVNKVTTCNK